MDTLDDDVGGLRTADSVAYTARAPSERGNELLAIGLGREEAS